MHLLAVVRAGTQGGIGVSKTDLVLRVKREQVKRRMLQNLHVFVSTSRLCVNNLPERINDQKLRAIFKKHAPDGAKITEVCHNFSCSYAQSFGLTLKLQKVV